MIRWHVIRSKHRNENLLWQQLCNRQIDNYYPRLLDLTTRARKDRPFFPGYLFVHVDLSLSGTSALEWIPGAIGLVSFGGQPAFVPDSIVDEIRERVDELNRLGESMVENMQGGDDIEVTSGPFAGYRGIFGSRHSDRGRATVFLTFIRDQQLRVELPVDQISVIKPAQPALAT